MGEIINYWTFIYGPLAIFLVGVYGLLTQKNLFKLVISINIMDLGVNLYIIALGYMDNASAPIYTAKLAVTSSRFVDPVPQALVLTSIVISVAVTAFVLALVIKNYEKYNTLDLIKIKGIEND
ncbi:MAG: cation:proton antiporter [Candidatus Mcinerneyibacterium aminivorans]|uniref:Cation:proton antiporter n=1 Tax=Candidatus Mcinerneyibacterium aminivorans TaxID=2703815 RepID=A0A5D0MG81_9BACT|nr:MAG: cation:proton antiporter [Candidatus Mcinerneyibacterium aminivorans]